MAFCKRNIQNLREAYKALKDVPNGIFLKQDNDYKYIECVVEKGHWYRGDGNYSYYDGTVFLCAFTEYAMKKLFSEDESAKSDVELHSTKTTEE